jgi:hypothetical protein
LITFILWTIIHKYLSRKSVKVYWIFIDLQKAFDTVVREALWWKLGKKGLSTKFIEGIKGIYTNVKITEKFEGNHVLEKFYSNIGLRQGCSLSPVLFNIFIDDILGRLEKANTHHPVIRKRQVAGLLFADDLAVGGTTIIGLQRVINCMKDFCEEWSLKINVAKTKIVVFKKGGKLSGEAKRWFGGEKIEVVKEIKYLGVVLDSRGKWEKERKQVAIRGKSTLNNINICVARAPNIEVNVLEQWFPNGVSQHPGVAGGTLRCVAN